MTSKTKKLMLDAWRRVLGRRYMDGLPLMPFTDADMRAFNKAYKLLQDEPEEGAKLDVEPSDG